MGAIRQGPDGKRTMLASDLADLEHRYQLTPAEAEAVWGDVHLRGQDEAATAQRVISGRVEYRLTYDQVPGPVDPTP